MMIQLDFVRKKMHGNNNTQRCFLQHQVFFVLWIALLYQLVDFGATFISNINCLPINLDAKGN